MKIKKIILFFIALVFVMMTALPANQSEIKIVFLILIFIMFLLHINAERLNLYSDLSTTFWWLLLITYGLIWSIYGYYNEQKSAIDYFRLSVIWPIIFYVLIQILTSVSTIISFEKIFKIIVIVITLYNVNFICHKLGMPSFDFLTGWDEYEAIGIHPGYVQLNNQNIGSLIFIAPFLISLFIIKGLKKLTYFDYLIIIFIALNIILSGRRALLFTSLLAIPLTYIVLAILNRKIFIKKIKLSILLYIPILIVGFIILYFNILGFDQNNLIDRIMFRNTESHGLDFRLSKSIQLIEDAYLQNILIGVGGGGIGFEVKYIMVLNQTGLIGLAIYIFLLTSALFKIISLIKSHKICIDIGIPLVVGYMSFILGDAINPLSGSFDFMWMLFVPILATHLASKKVKFI
jgi:hypothetical protein